MIALLQRVSRAEVVVENETIGRIGKGLLVFLGVERGDREIDAKKLAERLAELRIFEDGAGKMNRNVLEASGEILLVSQFTLAADLSRGRRPSFDSAAPPDLAESLYHAVVDALKELGVPTATGRFGAKMSVTLCNDGPVTFIVKVGRE
jgi:D-tyrosyl-tRNA(Tyr) deacylase